MSKRLAAKAGMIQALGIHPTEVAPQRLDASEVKAKTAPGAMMQFLSSQSEAIKEADALREQIKRFDGSIPVLSIDPTRIRASRWANRHAKSFEGDEFKLFKEEIASAGGNVQPVRVRPIGAQHSIDGVDDGGFQYELVFGHRRHRACLELGIPVSALVDEATDQELFEAMERENRNRKNLSAWEQGCMYQRAIEEGLYASQRKLAEAINVDQSLISKSRALARLPAAVVEAFPSPLDIQFRWAQPLSEALEKDPVGVLARAEVARAKVGSLTAIKVLELLTATGSESGLNRSAPSTLSIGLGGKNVGKLSIDELGNTVIKVDAGVLQPSDAQAFVKHLEEFLAR